MSSKRPSTCGKLAATKRGKVVGFGKTASSHNATRTSVHQQKSLLTVDSCPAECVADSPLTVRHSA
jgi:hypothetical protein